MGFAAFRLALKEHPEIRRMVRSGRKRNVASIDMVDKINEAFNADNIDDTQAKFIVNFQDDEGNDNYVLGVLMPEILNLDAVQRASWRAVCNNMSAPLRRVFERLVVRNFKREDPLPLKLTTKKLSIASKKKINFSIRFIEHPAKDEGIYVSMEANWLDDKP